MFPGWQGLPGKVKYVFGGPDGSSYTASWRIPATVADVDKARALASKVSRYASASYPYSDRIVHPYYPDLVIMTAQIQGLDNYKENTGDPFTDSTSNSPVFQNVESYEATFEWRQRPRNRYKAKHAFVRTSFEGSFQELPGSVVEAHPKGTTPPAGDASRKALPTGVPTILREQQFQVVYDFIPEDAYDEDHLQNIQGKINDDVSLFGRGKGCVLYVNSEKEDIVDSLGTYGFQVTHNFVRRGRDWNITDATPPAGSTSRDASEAIMVIRGLDSSDANRPYQYHAMKGDKKLFYYGWEV
ncbi:hypothetical protein GC170_14435 [bacterium]|nr:hypothetical protein [bacterium]